MTKNKQTDDENLGSYDAAERIWRGLSNDTKSALMMEAMRQASEDQRKVMDKWTANAQDSNKIYWKG